MFKGYDRAKYDLKDPSAWHAMKRDEALHEENLLMIARHLNSQTAQPIRQGGPQMPQILLPPAQQAALTTQIPADLEQFESTELGQVAAQDPSVAAALRG